jgi:putative two-component system hydrogenase maturation factor HypX/HoxX
MKILFIATSFNGMTQRAWVELDRLDHQVKVHIASSPVEMTEVVNEYIPDLIIAPYLKTAIPEFIWKKYTCFIIHPGIAGDRGSSSLDWAILNNTKEWGVTILQAAEKMDTGSVWAEELFPMRNVTKSCLYRHEVTQAAMKGLLSAVERFGTKNFVPKSFDEIKLTAKGKWNRATRKDDFGFLWDEETDVIIRKINAADSYPGATCSIFGDEYFCYGASKEGTLKGSPGEVLAQRHHAICIATKDGGLWITCLKKNEEGQIKLPATVALGDKGKDIHESAVNIFEDDSGIKTFREISYHELNEIGYLHFDFYNGAMSTEQCNRLLQAFILAKQRDTKIIVLMGGGDTWSNGIHLNLIEAAEDPAQASWENINAIDDLIHEIICTETHYVISTLQGNAGAGGVALALAADKVLAKTGIIFNPHTRNMGLYGSEYWTYLLPKRIGTQRATLFTEQCLPWGTGIAMEVKLIDDCFGDTAETFIEQVKINAEKISRLSYFPQLLTAKKFKRNRDESYKPLQKYREEELEKMRKNFFEDDWGYDYKRYCFVHKINPEEKINGIAGKDLFSERRKIWRRRKHEKLFYEP